MLTAAISVRLIRFQLKWPHTAAARPSIVGYTARKYPR